MIPPYFKSLFPLAVFLFLTGIAVALWQDMNSRKRELVIRHTETSAEQVRIRIEGLMNARMASLRLLVERWVERTPPDFTRKRFLQFAEAIYTNYPGFFGINWVDPEGVIRWVFPEEDNARAIGQRIYVNGNALHQEISEKTLQAKGLVATRCADLLQGGVGFDTFWPLVCEGRIQGYLNGVFQVKRIMDTCLAKDMLKDFQVWVYEGDRPVYTSGAQIRQSRPGEGLRAIQEIGFPGKKWLLKLEPSVALYQVGTVRNLPFLIFGIGISAFISLLLYFLIRRMELYREARDNALHEVTERRRAEEALRENEKKLEALVSEVAAKNAELETFVYTVSHDLKTPLVTVEGFAGALSEDFGEKLSEKGKKYLDYITDASHKMEDLINDLLELSRIGRVRETMEEVPFLAIVEEALSEVEHKIKERNIQVDVRRDFPYVYGERKRLVQVVENLLSNAVKYVGNDHPSPLIEVGVDEKDDQNIFFVRDNGIGIEERFFERIFQVFERLPAAKKLAEGTGIGLATAKRIIENHGGRIWVSSVPEKGSTFYFTIGRKEF